MAKNIEVRMIDPMDYDQQHITIDAGDTVSWINDSGSPHTVTREPTSTLPWTAVTLGSGEYSERFSFPAAGVLNYYCTIHGHGMNGSVTVI